jgi:uncharacterized OsmC-like protein
MTTATDVVKQDRAQSFSVSVTLLDGYAFRTEFDDAALASLHTDEPRPLGAGTGPSPSRLLAAAVANCLAASLVHCLRRARVDVAALTANAGVDIGRNEHGRLRVKRIAVGLQPSLSAGTADQLARCERLFEEYCTVTASIRDGIDVAVTVSPMLTPVTDRV